MRPDVKLKDWKLRQKIILHIFVVGLVTLTLLAYLYFTTQKNIINSLSFKKAELVGSMIESNLSHQIGPNQAMNLGPTLSRITASSAIKNLRILNLEGKIINSSDSEEIGSSLEKSQLDQLVEMYGDLDQPDIYTAKPASPTLSYVAIPNKEECFGCHSPEKKINGILQVSLDTADTSALLRRNQVKGVIIGILALGTLTFIIIRLFEKIINRPLSRLKQQMEEIESGNLSIHLEPEKHDEIGDLTKRFSIMIEKLNQAQQKIEDLHNQQIEKAGHLASVGELAAGLAHEIKNPVAGIKGALEIIQQKTDIKDPKREIFGEILKQTDKIHDITQDLLSYAKPKILSKKPVNPNNCILDAIKLASAQTRDKDIQFNFKGLKKDTLILIDENKIQEVMLNLLINSIAAIEEKGGISIAISTIKSEELEIIVTDNGKGIKPEHLSQIFNPFFTTRKRGTGLGLSICRQIIEAHSGSIHVKSQLGKGTTFSIRIPVSQENKHDA